MRRALGVGLVFLLTGCGLRLEDLRVPFACDRSGGDGGQQCAVGWSCGYDNRCFRRQLPADAGALNVPGWRCENDTHCPNDWRCGQELDGERRCQALGVGAPSPCLDDQGCEGGWRCGGDGRCFDPSDTADAGARDCTANSMCPDTFRCEQFVEGRDRRCFPETFGTAASCTDDDGCVGGWRCDRFNQRCVQVTDAVLTGHTGALAAQRLSPRTVEPAPRLFAMTPFARVPWNFGAPDASLSVGVLMAAVQGDGGVRVTTQLRDDQRRPDAGVQMLFERTFPIPFNASPDAVTDLAVGGETVGVRLVDGRAFLLSLTSPGLSWVNAMPDGGLTSFLRQRDARFEGDLGRVVVVAGREVRSGPLSYTLPSVVREVVFSTDDEAHVFTADGGFFVWQGDAGVTSPALMGLALTLPSLSVTAGGTANPQGDTFRSFVSEVRPDGGPAGFVSLSSFPLQGSEGWVQSPVTQACPDGSPPLQLTVMREAGGRTAVLARCKTTTGVSYPVSVSVFGQPVRYEAVIEDATPFQGEVISQRAGPYVRAHASGNGRAWHAMPPADVGTYDQARGDWPLRPVVLDRQPTALVSYLDRSLNAPRVYASAGGRNYALDLNGGLVSELRPPALSPLGRVQGRDDLLIGDRGLVLTSTAEARLVATLAADDTLEPPASGAATALLLEGERRDIVLVASGDAVWAADLTEALLSPFAQPATLTRVLVPAPGVRLRSLALEPSSTGLSGYATTNTANLRFATTDLVRWSLEPVPTPATAALPLAVWSDLGDPARTGFSDGRVWSLPVMVELTRPLVASDGGALRADDYGRKCGDLFVATSEGVFRAEATTDGGLPEWRPVLRPDGGLDAPGSLRLFESRDTRDRLFVGTSTGRVLELTGDCR